ncbi:putative quinol monooxygenase [Mycobacterium sp. pUA109]|uniref:putative quinol monooxygenase n=1 Tax=Mycobacterium sp. pUA109 TaxID=3238982 RepID=UPI00351B6497
MTVQVIMEVTLKEGHVDDFRDFMIKILPDSRAYEGSVSIDFVRNQDSPNQVLVMEKWNSRRDYEHYLKWRAESGTLNEIAGIFEGEPKLRFFDPMGL